MKHITIVRMLLCSKILPGSVFLHPFVCLRGLKHCCSDFVFVGKFICQLREPKKKMGGKNLSSHFCCIL